MIKLLINIDVANLDLAIDFYCRGLGLTPGRRFGDGFAELLGADSDIYLLAKAEGSAAIPGSAAVERTYRRHWTPLHIDFVVDDLAAAVERARDAGATVEAEPTTKSWGAIALLADPFGNGFCLLELNEAGYDDLLEA